MCTEMLAEGISLAGLPDIDSGTCQPDPAAFAYIFLSAFCVSQLEAINRTSIGDYFVVVYE